MPLSNNELYIGRSSDNDIIVNDQHVSKRHAKLVKKNGVFEIIDLGSTSGTFLNEQKITRSAIKPGDELFLSEHHRFNWDNSILTDWLYKVSGVADESSNTILIGRSEECDIGIFHSSISRHHARISSTEYGIVIEDLGSKGGTRVNGRKIRESRITPSDNVQFSQKVTLDWNHPVLSRWLQRNSFDVAPISKRKSPLPWIFGSVAAALVVFFTVFLATGQFGSGELGECEITDVSGIVRFTDNTTGEDVKITVLNSLDEPLRSIEVTFFDHEGFEMFTALDPSGQYYPSLEIYPHNSEHVIRMFTNSPSVREIDPDSPEGRAYLGAVNEIQTNWHYLGEKTADQLEEDGKILMYLTGPFTGGAVNKIYGKVGDIADILEALRLLEKPKLFNMYSIQPADGDNLYGNIYIGIPSGWDTPALEDQIANADIGGRFDDSMLPDTATVFIYAVDQHQVPLNFMRSDLQVQESSDGYNWSDVDFTYTFTGDLSSRIIVSFALDYSASMNPIDISRMEDAVVEFLNLMTQNDGAEIVKFSTYAETVQHWNYDKTRVIHALLSNWAGSDGMTALYDAVCLSCDNPDVTAAVVLTDGQENESSHSFQDAVNTANSSNIPVFTIGLGNNVETSTLSSMASNTGGFYYHSPSSDELEEIYQKIGGVLENTYRITWRPRTQNRMEGYARVILSLIGTRETVRDTVVINY